ncbi:MAG: 2-oxo acid dehydrogenase subunit E2 [Candidatus Dormibacteraceae bacterium]
MPDVRLPKLADTLVEGTITHWLKQPGEAITEGEALVEVETDKVNTELEAPASGVLAEIVAQEGETVPVDALLARIEGPGGDGDTAAPEKPADPPAKAAPPSPGESSSLPAMRRRIAERMQEARATVDQAACSIELLVDGLHPAAGWNACFVKALSEAGGYRSVGVAVEVPGGLVVPVLHDLPARGLAAVAEQLRDLARRARSGELTPAEVAGGEVTITNVGSTGTLLAFPLVNPGQPAILCPGQVAEGRLQLTLCYDRQAMGESDADGLLARVGAELQELAA